MLTAASPRLKEIIVAALDTGMRRGEILNQLWEDVDFDRRLLSVTKSKTPEGECREIPLTTRLFNVLLARREPDGIIFIFQDHAIRSIKTSWGTTLKRAGFAIIRVGDAFTTDEVVFAEKGDLLLLGARTLEGLNLVVNSRDKKLVATGPIPAA